MLAELARMDLPLARLAEAHVDALAILAEAGREPLPGLYGVWAAETAHLHLQLSQKSITGTKMFCTGAGLLDRVLITAGPLLLDVSLRDHPDSLTIDHSSWKTSAFADTQTATVTFCGTPVTDDGLIREGNWYVDRPGFWHGACGPAACWAGGAMGLFDYARMQSRNDSHTLAHLAAMHADVWALWAYLDKAGAEIDSIHLDKSQAERPAAMIHALTMRHLIEQAAMDILQRLGRAYGPRALAFNAEVSQRYQEVELYIRQSHAERDLELLGRNIHSPG